MAWGYYGYQLSKGPRKFGDQILTFTRCCCHLQLATFPVAPYSTDNSSSLATRRIIFGTWHYTMWNICGI